MTTEQFHKFVQNGRILIIGDVMLDSYLFGKVERISPEAPVPVVSVVKRENRIGGAANVAMNIKSLGATPYLCSVIGADERGAQLLKILEDNILPVRGIIQDAYRKTTTKFRIIGNNVQMLRVDEELDTEISLSLSAQLYSVIEEIIQSESIHCVIIQDYDKGVITTDLIDRVISFANLRNIPVAVDPKKRNFNSYKNITLFKPNFKEFSEGLKMEATPQSPSSLSEHIKVFCSERNMKNCMVTLGENGLIMLNSEKEKFIHIPAHLRQVSDVSGAGDTVISVAGLCLAAGLDFEQTAILSNLAGGLVCQYVGVVPLDRNEFFREIERLNIFE